jgi:hypothetical protein
MKYTFNIFICILPLLIAGNTIPVYKNFQDSNISSNNPRMSGTINIKTGDKFFTATLLDNATAMAFKAMLPLTINVAELNGNEKYFRLPADLQANASNPGTIKTGDLMLWGANTIVLFNKSFSTSYTYTKVGKIDDPTGLAAALGSDDVKVTFELCQER